MNRSSAVFRLALALAAAALSAGSAAAQDLEYRPSGPVDLSRLILGLFPAPRPEPLVISGATPPAAAPEDGSSTTGDDAAAPPSGTAPNDAESAEVAAGSADASGAVGSADAGGAGDETQAEEPPAGSWRRLSLDPVFSVLDVLPMGSVALAPLADVVESPVLAGGRRAAGARGLEPLGPGAAPGRFGKRRIAENQVFGGFASGALFGGYRLSLGGEFGTGDDLVPFGRVDLGLEYDKYLGEDLGGKVISVGLVGGMAGTSPLPWLVAGRVLLKDASPEGGRGILVLEAGDQIAELGDLGTVRAAGGLAFEATATDTAFLRASALGRGRLELEGRRYRGALGRGLAAYLSGEAGYDLVKNGYGPAPTGDPLVDDRLRADFRAGFEAETRFGGLAGLRGSLSFRAGSDAFSGWADSLRGVSDRLRPISGDLGFLARIELPLLFARGRLFLDPGMGVEFFLKPYLDAALVRPSRSAELLLPERCFLAAGGELAMTLDWDRREAFRLFCGLDLSTLLRGSSGAPGSEDLEFAAVFSVAF